MVSELLPLAQFQPIGFPAPLWLMQLLLVVTFLLHAVPMNITLVGGALAGLFLIEGKNDESSFAARAGRLLAMALPFITTATITLGIAPLLFLQVIYGPLVYTSSVLMAVPWIAILFLLNWGYYALYSYQYGPMAWLKNRPWGLIVSSLLFIFIAFFFVNNMSLMLTPEKFLPMYEQSRAGLNLNLSEPSLIPRYLHFGLSAIAVTGLALGSFGLYYRNRDAEYANWLIKRGSGMFVAMTLANLGVGWWFLKSLPANIGGLFLGGNSLDTALFMGGLTLGVIALIFVGLAAAKGCVKNFIVGLSAAVLVVADMVVMRHIVREAMLAPVFAAHPAMDPYKHAALGGEQWGALTLFLLSFVFMLGYFYWLANVAWTAAHPKKDA